jgi:hypothetical protein
LFLHSAASLSVWQRHLVRLASGPFAFERRQTAFDRPDDIDQLLQRIGDFWRKLA